MHIHFGFILIFVISEDFWFFVLKPGFGYWSFRRVTLMSPQFVSFSNDVVSNRLCKDSEGNVLVCPIRYQRKHHPCIFDDPPESRRVHSQDPIVVSILMITPLFSFQQLNVSFVYGVHCVFFCRIFVFILHLFPSLTIDPGVKLLIILDLVIFYLSHNF